MDGLGFRTLGPGNHVVLQEEWNDEGGHTASRGCDVSKMLLGRELRPSGRVNRMLAAGFAPRAEAVSRGGWLPSLPRPAHSERLGRDRPTTPLGLPVAGAGSGSSFTTLAPEAAPLQIRRNRRSSPRTTPDSTITVNALDDKRLYDALDDKRL